MSYNIQHGEGEDKVLSLPRIAKIIYESGAEVAGIQEIDRFYSDRSNYEDQVKQLSDMLSFNYTYGVNLDLPSLNGREVNRQYGTAIFSKYPILDYENILLPSFGAEQRGLLRAKIDIGGTHFNIYNTHLGLDRENRLAQIKEIIKVMSSDKEPHLILGDFNAEPVNQELQYLIDKTDLKDVFQEVPNASTHNANQPTKRIDYIFASSQVKFSNPLVIHANGSDHLPIIVELEV